MKAISTILSLHLLLTPSTAIDYSDYITTTTSQDGSILLLGDSWASIAGDYAANICGLSNARQVTNDAKSGTTAEQWADGETAINSLEKAEYDYEYVWLSLGGNDFLDAKCDISISEQVAQDIVTVIGHIVDNASNPNIRILYFGYSVPSSDICGNGQTAKLFETQGAIIFKAIKSSDYGKYVTTFDISEMFVKWNSGGLSDPYYYYDDIHLNQMGYLHLFSSYRVQRFFGCSPAQTLELKGVSAVVEGKDNPAHLVKSLVSAVVGLILWVVALVFVVKYLKKRFGKGGGSSGKEVELLDPSEKAETGDYVVVDKEKKPVMA